MAVDAVHNRYRVVVENADWASSLEQMAALEGAGFSVVACGGPESLPGQDCPAISSGRCPWLDAADVVLHDLDLDVRGNRAVLKALRRSYPDLPIVLELPDDTVRDNADLLRGCRVIPPVDLDRLIHAVTEAVIQKPPRLT